MAVIEWDETPDDSLNRLIHEVVFGADGNKECHGHFEPDGWDNRYAYYRCPFCGFRTQVPMNQRELASLYLAPHFYVPDYVGTYEGAELIFRTMRATDRATRDRFHTELERIMDVFPPLKQHPTLIAAFSLIYTLGRSQMELVAIAALRTYGYHVNRGKRRVAA